MALVWWGQGVRLRLDKWMRAFGVHCGDVIAVTSATCGGCGGCKQLKYSPLGSWTAVCHGLNGREEGEGRMLLCRSWQLMQVQDILRTGRAHAQQGQGAGCAVAQAANSAAWYTGPTCWPCAGVWRCRGFLHATWPGFHGQAVSAQISMGPRGGRRPPSSPPLPGLTHECCLLRTWGMRAPALIPHTPPPHSGHTMIHTCAPACTHTRTHSLRLAQVGGAGQLHPDPPHSTRNNNSALKHSH